MFLGTMGTMVEVTSASGASTASTDEIRSSDGSRDATRPNSCQEPLLSKSMSLSLFSSSVGVST